MAEYFCKECGAPISSSGARKRGICRACSLKHVSENKKAKWEQMDKENPIFCQWCGKQIHWNAQRKFQGVSSCSKQCQGYLMQAKRKETPEHLTERLVAYIKEQDHYVSLRELRKTFHLSDKLLYTRGLSVPKLNKLAGRTEMYTDNTKTKEELEAEYAELVKTHKGLRGIEAAKLMETTPKRMQDLGINLYDLKKKLQVHSLSHRESCDVEKMIVDWLRTQPVYRNAQDICRALHLDYKCSIQNNELDVVVLNAKAGHKRASVSYFEDYTAFKLVQEGIQIIRQKTFPECKYKNLLRYDFWLPEYNTLLEINGEHHYSPKYERFEYLNTCFEIKRKYAEEHNIAFVVLKTAPSATFQERLQKVIEEIKGASEATHEDADSTELLEASACDDGGNQQPRPNTTHWIQLQFDFG